MEQMSDQNDLSISIRARILPVLEGVDQLKSQIDQLPTTVHRLQETVQSPVFKEGLSTQQLKKVDSLVSGVTESYDFEKIQEREKNLFNDYKLALENGKLSRPQIASYNKKFTQLGSDYANFGDEFISPELNKPPITYQQGQEYTHESIKGKLLSIQEDSSKAFFQEDQSRKSYGIDLPQSLSQSLDPDKLAILKKAVEESTQQARMKIPDITEKLNQINFANEYTRTIGKIETSQFQRHKNLEYDLAEGGYTKARGQRYSRENKNDLFKLEEMREEAFEKFGKTDVFEAISDHIDSATQRMQKFSDEIEKAGKVSGNLLESLKAAGVLAVASTAVNAGLDYWTAGKRIEAAERTSFDFGSPMGMYSAERQFELFKENTERSRDYKLVGGLGGAVAGGLAGIGAGPAGVLFGATAGYFGGSSLLGQFAEGLNIEKTGEVSEQIKRRQQVYEQLNGMVSGSGQYDILRARTRARIGADAIGSLDLGYMPEEELQMRTQFADARGKYDPQLYKEQTTFARAEGIDPNAIYQLDLSARMTGMDVGISGLDRAKQLATATYGENVTSQRVVDVLNDLKNINERMLDVNMNMDSREAAQLGMIPSLIFGKDSPFGRLGEKATDSMNVMDRFTKPNSLAAEAFLYQAFGEKDITKFMERKRKGIWDVENFNDISSNLNSNYGSDPRLMELAINAMVDPKGESAPAGMIPKIRDFMMSGKRIDEKELEQMQKDYGIKTLGEYQTKAEGAVSQTEKFQSEQKTIANQIGDDYRKMINKMSLDWLTTWRDLSLPTNNRIILENQLNDVLGESIKRFKEFFLDGGKTGKPGSEADQYNKGKGHGRFEGPPIPEGEALEEIKKKLGREDTGLLKDAKGEEATGFVKDKMLELQKALSESPLGMRYRTSLYEGDATTGHAPGSLHYTGKAFDTSLYDKFAHKKIDADNYPSEVKTFYQEFADEQGLKYGGSFKRSFRDGKFIAGPDNNHFQEGVGSPANAEFDYDKLEHNKKLEELAKERQAKEKQKPIAQLSKEFEEEIIYRDNPLKYPKKAAQEAFEYSQEFVDRSTTNIIGKEKEHSFYEPRNKSRSEENSNFDPNTIRSAIVEGFRELARGNNDRQETRIVVEDRTQGGISAEQLDYARHNANSIFK